MKRVQYLSRDLVLSELLLKINILGHENRVVVLEPIERGWRLYASAQWVIIGSNIGGFT